MDLCLSAGYQFTGRHCECCDAEIVAGQSLFYDIDGEQVDGSTHATVRVRCEHCHRFVLVQVARAKHAAFVAAAQDARACETVAEAYETLITKARTLPGMLLAVA